MVNYFIIQMYPLGYSPELELLTGGWIPVSQILGVETAVCAFTDRSKATKYKDSYNELAMGQVKKLELFSVTPDQVRKLKIISDKFTTVAIDPTLEFGQFSVNQIKPIDDFAS